MFFVVLVFRLSGDRQVFLGSLWMGSDNPISYSEQMFLISTGGLEEPRPCQRSRKRSEVAASLCEIRRCVVN